MQKPCHICFGKTLVNSFPVAFLAMLAALRMAVLVHLSLHLALQSRLKYLNSKTAIKFGVEIHQPRNMNSNILKIQ